MTGYGCWRGQTSRGHRTAGKPAIVSRCASVGRPPEKSRRKKRREPHDREQGATNLQLPCGESHRGGEKPRGWNASIARRRARPERDSTESRGVDARTARWRGSGCERIGRSVNTASPRGVIRISLWGEWANPGDEEARGGAKARRSGASETVRTSDGPEGQVR